MAKRRRNDMLLPALAVAIDAAAIGAAFLLSYWLRFESGLLAFLPLNESIPPFDAYATGSMFIVAVWLLLFRSHGMYAARRNVSLRDEFGAIVRRVTFGMLMVMSAAFFYRAFSYSRVVFGLLWCNAIVFVTVGRALFHRIERVLYRSGRELERVVIIGTAAPAERLVAVMHENPGLGYDCRGYVADAPAPGGSALAALPYLGTPAALPELLVQEDAGLAFIALDHAAMPTVYALMQACEGIACEFLLVPDVLSLALSGVQVRDIEGIPLLRIKGMPITAWGRILKRLFDLLVSLILLAVLLPLFAVVAILIKLTSPGPVLYRQERVGLDGERFAMLKFRSMRLDAEAKSGPVWAKEHDPRRTRFGTFLRRTSIDELPQLWNVFAGSMSLVGPRPERPFFVDKFKSDIPQYLDRHRMKTGMTGWAQVNGLRGNTSLEERVKYDIYYIENWSLGFDLRILFRTIGSLMFTRNAH